MTFFDREKYNKKFLKNPLSQEKKQVDFYFDFLLQMFESDELDEDYFGLINCDDLLESLKNYIRVSKITARGTASSYIGNIRKLYENLETYYGIKNEDIYVNKNFVTYITEKSKVIYATLNKTTDKETATDEEYENLLSNIKEEENKYSYNAAVEGFKKYVYVDNRNKLSDGPDSFRLIRAVCASRFVYEFGIKNKEIVKMKVSDVNLEQGIITRGRYKLRLSEEFKKSLIEYIKIRRYWLLNLEKESAFLFISRNGDEMSINQASNKLFGSIISKSNKKRSKSTDYFARKCLTRMINQGFNSLFIEEITGYKKNTYEKLCESINEDKEYTENKLLDFTKVDRNSKIETKNKSSVRIWKKGFIYCPECGRELKAVADELVLLKKENDEKLYLCCKICGGKYE